jgi:hypothetical protein
VIRAVRTAFVIFVGIPCVVMLPICATVLRAAESSQQDDVGQSARQMLKATGIASGVIVHIGCGDGSETADMLLGSRYLVHGLDTSSDNVSKARAYLRSKNLVRLRVGGPIRREDPSLR